ncbi:UvrD-helicase domain-containing protein [Miniphocaeibacter massiliensis]|uniref:UvrD-helicase domain-containing protein n=1 Tax=Miniphocaeibacter massiliensis TaxID=2041841 RepID=UPI000C06AC7F|nr:UvrD-helicase domain-containing protein [Miniphocaeibacter massiliensis]
MKLTNEQLKAIQTIDKNVIVNAGAGTGKTETLTRRYIEILKNGKLEKNNEISGIVAITFTIKAANEMKERIKELLLENSDDRNKDYLRQLSDSNISTIHSFCTKLIRENSYYLNIDPLFEVLEEKESQKILNTVISNILEKEGNEENFIILLMNSTERNDVEELINEIKNIYLKIKNTIYSIESIKNRTLDNIKKLNVEDKSKEIKDELKYINKNVKLRSNSKLYKFINDEANAEILEAENQINKKFVVGLVDSIKALDKNEELEYLKELINFQLQFEESNYYEIYSNLFVILKKIEEDYNKEKEKLGKYDFNDLEHLAHELLLKENIRKNIQRDIEYLMVDEYQDSNDIQKEIFYLICSENTKLDRNNFFVVGDPKQSIYGFRGSNINIFYNTREDIIETGGENIIFSTNYRSNKNLMTGINNIYGNIMKDRYDFLSSVKESTNKYNIFLINNDNKRDNNFEPEVISNFIVENIYENKRKAKDYTLLFRNRNGQEIFENNFREKNIPFYTFDSLGFYNSEEIKIIVEMLKLIKFNENNMSLYFIIKSQLYNLTDAEIFEHIKEPNEKIYFAVEGIFYKIENIRNKFNNKVSDFLSCIYEEFNLYEKYNYKENTIQKQGNLYKLLEIAHEYDRNNLTVDDLYYDLLDNNNDETMKQVEDENSEVVKLMTIHGSKGLGFNDVIVPYINKGINNKKELIKFRVFAGIAINFFGANYTYKILEEKDLEEEKIESDNIYYVAMTRAKENLVLGFSGIKSGYKKVLYDEIEKLKKDNKLKEINNIDDRTLRIEKIDKINDSVNFEFTKDIEKGKNNIIKSNISTILDFHSNGNKIKNQTIDKFRSYKDRVEKSEVNLPSNLIGDVIHRFAEMYKEPYNLELEEILKEFGLDNKNKEFFNKYIYNFKKLYNYEYDKSYEEVEFNYKYKNFLFRGIIDRIEVIDDRIIIIDYKFSNLRENELLEKYWPQLIFYGIVCEKIFDNRNIELIFKNIRRNYCINVEYKLDIKKKFEIILDNYIENVYKIS